MDNNKEFQLEIETAEELYGSYLVYSRTEILFLMNTTKKKSCPIHMYIGGSVGDDGVGRGYLTAFMGASERGEILYFDAPVDSDVTKALESAPVVFFATAIDKIKVQFRTTECKLTKWNGSTVLSVATPSYILRLQRREFFRLTPLRPGKLLVQGVQLSVIDISAGGISIGWVDSEQMPPLHHIFDRVKVSIPDLQEFTIDLEVRNMVSLPNRGGVSPKYRCGCEFVNPSMTLVNSIQKFISIVERKRAEL